VHGHGCRGAKVSFGSDGQPGSYTDVDHCDAIAL
jgi:ferredoxin-nitrate reductase